MTGRQSGEPLPLSLFLPLVVKGQSYPDWPQTKNSIYPFYANRCPANLFDGRFVHPTHAETNLGVSFIVRDTGTHV
jgi:hypothetical protein